MRIKPRMQLFLWTLRGKPYALLSLGSLAVLNFFLKGEKHE